MSRASRERASTCPTWVSCIRHRLSRRSLFRRWVRSLCCCRAWRLWPWSSASGSPAPDRRRDEISQTGTGAGGNSASPGSIKHWMLRIRPQDSKPCLFSAVQLLHVDMVCFLHEEGAGNEPELVGIDFDDGADRRPLRISLQE